MNQKAIPAKVTIEQLLDRVGPLPTIPRVVQKALNIIEDPKSSMRDLANVIKLDQNMTSLILRWVNSSYYSLRSNFVSIEQAIAYLGHRTVQNLVLSASIASFMNKPLAGYELEKGELWKRAVGMAAGAKLVIQDVAPDKAEDAYYAGLFCDVGKLAFHHLLQNIKVDWDVIGQLPFDRVEKYLFGFNHAEVGAEIIKRWKLAKELSVITEFHHSPSKVKGDWNIIAYAVHAADSLMMMFGIGTGLDSLQYKFDEKTLEIFKWDENTMSVLYEKLIPIIDEANKYISA